MTLFKKVVLAPLAFVAVAASVQAVADPINHTIQLEALVPTSTFYVLPSNPDWIGTTQVLSYSPVTKELTSLNKPFSALHTAGAITGKLLSTPMISSGANNIDLVVKFNGVTLGTTDQEVVSKDAAATETIANLEIIPVKPAGGYVPGKYLGSVNVSFDATI